jgi:hypothetical protein
MGGNQSNTSRNGACDDFSLDISSAARKATSNITVSANAGFINISKSTGDYNPKTDAFRSCSNCNKHYNYHGKK